MIDLVRDQGAVGMASRRAGPLLCPGVPTQGSRSSLAVNSFRPHPGANSLLPLEMIDAETIRKGEVPCRYRLIDPVDLPGGSDSSIDVKHHLAAPLNVGDGFAEGGEPIGRGDRYSNHA